MKRRVLIVTSSYAPTMIADMHRARHLAWELPALGWDVEILCPDATYQQPFCLDDDSGPFFSPSTTVHSVRRWYPALFRALQFGTIGWRALVPMYQAGLQLLRRRSFELVYFSTTQFALFFLGPAWRTRMGVPFVLDFHDPCYRENSVGPGGQPPALRNTINRRLIQHIESRSVGAASGVIAVSPNYLESLRQRYGARNPAWMPAARQAVIPFAAMSRDLDAVASTVARLRPPCARRIRIVYVGAGGPIMLRSFSVLCRALSHVRNRERELAERVRFELYGTMSGWREGEPRHLAELAGDYGVGDSIVEDPRHVSYRRSLELLLGGDGAVILGVDDSGYTPSKFFTYALSGKPLLAVLRRDSPAFGQLRSIPSLGHALWFDRFGEQPVSEAADVLQVFLQEAATHRSFDRRSTLEPFMAPAMARRHMELFNSSLKTTA